MGTQNMGKAGVWPAAHACTFVAHGPAAGSFLVLELAAGLGRKRRELCRAQNKGLRWSVQTDRDVRLELVPALDGSGRISESAHTNYHFGNKLMNYMSFVSN